MCMRMCNVQQGKAFSDSLAEVNSSIGFLEWFSEEAKRLYGDVVSSPIKSRRFVVVKQPIGVVGAITPVRPAPATASLFASLLRILGSIVYSTIRHTAANNLLTVLFTSGTSRTR